MSLGLNTAENFFVHRAGAFRNLREQYDLCADHRKSFRDHAIVPYRSANSTKSVSAELGVANYFLAKDNAKLLSLHTEIVQNVEFVLPRLNIKQIPRGWIVVVQSNGRCWAFNPKNIKDRCNYYGDALTSEEVRAKKHIVVFLDVDEDAKPDIPIGSTLVVAKNGAKSLFPFGIGQSPPMPYYYNIPSPFDVSNLDLKVQFLDGDHHTRFTWTMDIFGIPKMAQQIPCCNLRLPILISKIENLLALKKKHISGTKDDSKSGVSLTLRDEVENTAPEILQHRYSTESIEHELNLLLVEADDNPLSHLLESLKNHARNHDRHARDLNRQPRFHDDNYGPSQTVAQFSKTKSLQANERYLERQKVLAVPDNRNEQWLQKLDEMGRDTNFVSHTEFMISLNSGRGGPDINTDKHENLYRAACQEYREAFENQRDDPSLCQGEIDLIKEKTKSHLTGIKVPPDTLGDEISIWDQATGSFNAASKFHNLREVNASLIRDIEKVEAVRVSQGGKPYEWMVKPLSAVPMWVRNGRYCRAGVVVVAGFPGLGGLC
ncbi:hypothetical protein BJ875DRAFT_437069 [Amylocarpus encephaloides]|uniref:Uncharacterized protein n=1 Tax=Amylocarpus encephaloides TaxID=45428 RepID=A0A9P8C9W8_9HELO|nr:hypothetical protein BJ875DRAFT_437069 [Amylocarpus encephaloides]